MDKDEIKKIRLDLKLTQQEFASLLPVSIITISKWENGRGKPSKMAVIRIKQIQLEGGR